MRLNIYLEVLYSVQRLTLISAISDHLATVLVPSCIDLLTSTHTITQYKLSVVVISVQGGGNDQLYHSYTQDTRPHIASVLCL